MALDFPTTPTLNQEFVSGERKWIFDGQGWIASNTTLLNEYTKGVVIESPTASENITLFYTSNTINISKIVLIITGSTSVTTTIKYSENRSNIGTEIITGGIIVNSTTTGNIITSFDYSVIPANNFIWLETTSLSGTPTSLGITLSYTKS